MATLIAANYQSTTITSYGGMSMSCGTLKANTLYTLKCRYKYTKNTSSHPQILCYNTNWSYGGNILDATDDGVMKTRIITFTSYPSAVNYHISCYAWSYDDQNNGGGKTGVLEVDWYELWEGDATTFSLTDAYEQGTNNLFKWGDKPSSISGISNNGSSILLDSSTFGYNVYKCVSASHSSQMYIFYNSAALTSSLVTGKTYLATAEIYSPDSSTCNIDIEYSTILASSRSITPGQWSKVWVIGKRNTDGGAVTFYAPPGTYYYKNIHIAETPTSFLDLQKNYCTNTGYFSTAEPKNALRSWMGYYYKTHSSASYGDWVYTYNHYSSASRSRTVTTYDNYSNGKVVQAGSTTQTENATVTYAGWSYNWTTTGNSTRSRTVTYSWSDYSSSATQTETGGTRYLVLSDEKYVGDNIGEIYHTFPANGYGSKTFTVYSHDYWGGTNIATNVIYDASCYCDGFTCSVSGSTLTVTASNLGTTEKAYHKATIVTRKSGFEERAGYTGIAQEANVRTLSSVYLVPYKPDNSWVVDVTNGNWNTCPASGGFVKASGYANYTHTSGTPLNGQHITSDAALTWSTGYDSWITNHSNGGYRIYSRGTTEGSEQSSKATWSYGGKTSAAKTLTQAANIKTPVYGDINILNFYYYTIEYYGSEISPTCNYTQTCSYKYSSGDTESASNVSGQAGDGYTSFQRISGNSSASVNSSNGLVTWGTNSGTERSATIRVTVTRNDKTATKDASTTQTGAPQYGSWELVEVSSDTIDPIPVWENAVFTCTYRRTTPSGGYEYKNGSCSPSEYYNDGSGGSVWVSYYDPDGRYGGQKQFRLESEY